MLACLSIIKAKNWETRLEKLLDRLDQKLVIDQRSFIDEAEKRPFGSGIFSRGLSCRCRSRRRPNSLFYFIHYHFSPSIERVVWPFTSFRSEIAEEVRVIVQISQCYGPVKPRWLVIRSVRVIYWSCSVAIFVAYKHFVLNERFSNYRRPFVSVLLYHYGNRLGGLGIFMSKSCANFTDSQGCTSFLITDFSYLARQRFLNGKKKLYRDITRSIRTADLNHVFW